MGRPRQFAEADTIEAAMKVFWVKGYEATALPDLLKAMKLTRGSFYKAFGSKHTVYLLALQRYNKMIIAPIIDELRRVEGNGHERVRKLFRKLQKLVRSENSVWGCFLCKAAIEMAPHDDRIAREVTKTIRGLEQAFAIALFPDPLAKRKAGQLTGSYLGIQVLRNAGNSTSIVDGVVAETLRGLA